MNREQEKQLNQYGWSSSRNFAILTDIIFQVIDLQKKNNARLDMIEKGYGELLSEVKKISGNQNAISSCLRKMDLMYMDELKSINQEMSNIKDGIRSFLLDFNSREGDFIEKISILSEKVKDIDSSVSSVPKIEKKADILSDDLNELIDKVGGVISKSEQLLCECTRPETKEISVRIEEIGKDLFKLSDIISRLERNTNSYIPISNQYFYVIRESQREIMEIKRYIENIQLIISSKFGEIGS